MTETDQPRINATDAPERFGANSDAVLNAALDCARRGWKIFPVHSPGGPTGCSCGKECKKVGKHPRIKAWQSEATTDIQKITNWWTMWPDSNIGIVTGAASGIWVLDVDDKNGGIQTLDVMAEKCGELPPTLKSRTGAGFHLYFSHPGVKVKGSVQDIGDGIDVRGDGQYVIGPGSLHANGRRYEWFNDSVPVAHAPDWLLSLVTAESVDGAENDSEVISTSVGSPRGLIPSNQLLEGVRNNSLFRIACYLFSSGMPRDRVEPVMLLFNMVKCQPQLPTDEVKALVQSASTYSDDENSPDAAEQDAETSQTRRRKRRTKSRAPIFWHKNIPSQNLSDARLNLLEDYQLGWRSRALDFAFAQGCLLPNDAEQLRKLIRPSNRKKFDKEWPDALYDFRQIELDGQTYLYNPLLFGEYVDAAAQALVNRANGGKAHIGKAVSTRPPLINAGAEVSAGQVSAAGTSVPC